MEVRLIQRGERGLFISNGNKLLFPDRSWKDAREGFARDIEVVLDKGTYAFVRGKMLETPQIELSDIQLNFGVHYRVGEYAGTKFIIEWQSNINRDSGYRIFIKSQNEDGTSIETVKITGKRLPEVTFLSDFASSADVTETLVTSCSVLNFESDEQFAFEMFKLFQAIFERSEVAGKVKATIRVYNSSLVLIRHHFQYTSDSYEVYHYVGELGSGRWERMEGFPQSGAEKLYNKCEDFDMREVSDLAMDYKVCLARRRYSDNSFDDRLVSRVFECMGNGVVVYAFNMKGYGPEWFETEEAQPYIALVEESFARLDSLKRQLSKRGIGVDKLVGLNVRSWIMPFVGT